MFAKLTAMSGAQCAIFRFLRFQRGAIAGLLAALLAADLSGFGVLARASNYRADDGYNPQHISSLPPEIRTAVLANCSVPRALHSFAEYRDNLHTVTLHFEHFLCGTAEAYCSASGCLHRKYTLMPGGHYRLSRVGYLPQPDPPGDF